MYSSCHGYHFMMQHYVYTTIECRFSNLLLWEIHNKTSIIGIYIVRDR